MGRSVSCLSGAREIAYFNWPTIDFYNEETDEYEPSDEYEDAAEVIDCIQEGIRSDFPEFSYCSRWEGNEDHIILEGYECEVGLSEYCGGASLSIRVNESKLDKYLDSDPDDTEYDERYAEVEKWIDDNWEEISKGYNDFNKVGTFSNEEGVFEKVK